MAVRSRTTELGPDSVPRPDVPDRSPVPKVPEVPSSRGLSRRRVLSGAAGAAAGLVAAGLVGYEWPRGTSARTAGSEGAAAESQQGPGEGRAAAEAFVTLPDLQPPRVVLTSQGAAASSPRFIFLAARTYLSGTTPQQGLMILDRKGRLVWFKPLRAQPFDFTVQSYRGSPVLTWWEGKVVDGYGLGKNVLAGDSYDVLGQVKASGGLRADLHEFQITSRGTALLTAYGTVPADLSGIGGPTKGSVLTSHVQEIDIETGKLLWDWDSLSHVGLEESYEPLPEKGPYNYFHVNAISEMPDGQLLISGRNTWAVYKVDRSSGKILWRLGGKRSDFSLGPGSRFYWQHDARMAGPSLISVFDDGADPPEERQSRGLLLEVDTNAKHVALRRAYLHPARFLAANQGSVQLLPDGRVFVGWGNQPYFSDFSPGGELLLDGQLPFAWHSYRARTFDWRATPSRRPLAAALVSRAWGSVVFASWNGATEVYRWVVLAGPEQSSLARVGWQWWSGLETAVTVNSTGPWFAVVAEDVNGKEIGRSLPVKLGG